jgi:divalent metal cation (Fe/Co/Zn/Cd) transporter
VGAAFFALAVILVTGAVVSLAEGRRPDDSVPGVVYLGVTAVVMFTLSFAKRRLGTQLGEHPLAHEARITFLDGVLATGVLLALAVNLAFGWWWADAVAAAMVGIVAIPEGLDAWRDSRDLSRVGGAHLDEDDPVGQSMSTGSSSPESTS